MKQTTISNRLISLLLCMAMILSLLPAAAVRSWAAEPAPGTTPGLEAAVVADAGTAHTWETMMGTAHDGNRYAGRVWADKSVYTNGQSALLDTSGTAYPVQLQAGESFQLIFSVLGSSMTTTTTNTYVGPMDVVLVLDSSTSMANTAGGVTRLQRTLEAANTLMENLLTVSNIRIALVSYNANSETILPLDFYPNGVVLSANNYTGTGSGYRGATQVQVTVAGGRITDVTVLSSEDDRQYFSRAQSSLIAAILNAQGVDVSTVSGATFSSNGILEAVADALNIDFTNPNATLSRGRGGRGRK